MTGQGTPMPMALLCIAAPAIQNMNPFAVVLLASAMSADAFAAAVVKGSALREARWSEALRTGAIFSGIEAITPVVGWALGSIASSYIKSWDHWIAFFLLSGLGLRMIFVALSKPAEEVVEK